ncbi:uncharacterized protein LOC113272345 [Papaver somniferum]|uniref:uncharacterized protein LOC113272345 n=1 Tax=Papaver somniferum TaxID=3469 RepID=UPI000E702BF5|nr:uncharacterized protein LOC113272345 [Papaver somniferum]
MSNFLDKSWMRITDIYSPEYREGVRKFIVFAMANGTFAKTCACPCRKCENRHRLGFSIVRNHLYEHGVDKTYTTWSLHGERKDGASTSRSKGKAVVEQTPDKQSDCLNFNDFIDSSFGIDHDGTQIIESPLEDPDVEKLYNRYKSLAAEKLYPGCEDNLSILSAMVEMHNMKKTYKISGKCVNSFLDLLREWLPKPNKFPKNYDAMRSMLKDLGMKAKAIHACENHCILYYKDNEDLIECPVCKTLRFKLKATKDGHVVTNEPCKVLRYFPVDEKLKKIYSLPWISDAMLWHDRAQVSFEYMCHPIYSSQWAQMKMKFPLFAAEGRNVWLGISTDGFNPHGVQTLSWSCWPVILVVYNLPPSMCMKYEFQMMTLLIPGRKPPGQDIDVFLRPLVNTLKKLWHQGVQAFDSLKREYFTLKSNLMFGIHELPAQGVLSGCTTHGYCACVYCGDETRSTHLGYGSKIAYTNYRIFLRSRHPFRDGTFLGLETHEHKSAPLRLTGAQSLEKLADVHYEPGKLVVRKTGKRKRYQSDEEEGDFELVIGDFYKKCILWELESSCALTIRHCVDVMHTEKNVMEHIIYTIFDKDNKAIVAWNNHDKLKENKLNGGALKDKKTKKVVVSREYLNQAKWMIAESMCVLEKYFPDGFFDISVHNMVHLADEALVCGSVRTMKECKNIPNNSRYIQGSITKLTEMDDCVRFSMEHMKNADQGGHKENLEPFLKDEHECSDVGSLLDEKLVHVENGITICQDSYCPLVNLSRLKSHTNILDEPVILAEEAAQVFYSRDVKHPEWWVVIHTPRGMNADVDKAEIPGRDSFQDILEEEPHLRKFLGATASP